MERGAETETGRQRDKGRVAELAPLRGIGLGPGEPGVLSLSSASLGVESRKLSLVLGILGWGMGAWPFAMQWFYDGDSGSRPPH